jgi:hypothetical protein
VRKKYVHRGFSYALILASAALAAFAASAIINSCTPKESSQKTQKSPYGTPEYVIELPPGYEDLKVISPNDQAHGAQPLSGSAPTNESQSTPQGDGAAVARLARPQGPEQMAPKVSGHPTLIIVIDDVGYNNGELKPFLRLPFPITFAVLPQLPHSADSALAIREAGKELILHQPMEALGGNDPGPHAVYLSMDEATIEKTVAENIDSLPYPPAGMNNHMGSAVTRDKKAMAPILKLVKERGMYYLDSLTAPGTVTAELCRETETPYMERNVFLDNNTDRESILAAIDEGKRIARKNSAAVMIGHVWSANLAATLMDIYPELVEEGYSLSTISEYMRMQAEENTGHADSGD